MSKEEIVTRLCAAVARELEIRALLICKAPDPRKMVELLKPRISDPDIDGGRIPQMYFDLANAELQQRAARCGARAH